MIPVPRPRGIRAPRREQGLDDGPAARHRPRWRPRSRPRCAAAWWVSGAAVCVVARDHQARPRQSAAIPVRAAAAVPGARASALVSAGGSQGWVIGAVPASGVVPAPAGPRPVTAGPPGGWPGTTRLSSAPRAAAARFRPRAVFRYMTASSGPSPKAAQAGSGIDRQGAEGEYIGRCRDLLTGDLLRGHVVRGADPVAGAGQLGILRRPGNAKVDHPGPVGSEKDIRRLQVTVDTPAAWIACRASDTPAIRVSTVRSGMGPYSWTASRKEGPARTRSPATAVRRPGRRPASARCTGHAPAGPPPPLARTGGGTRHRPRDGDASPSGPRQAACREGQVDLPHPARPGRDTAGIRLPQGDRRRPRFQTQPASLPATRAIQALPTTRIGRNTQAPL